MKAPQKADNIPVQISKGVLSLIYKQEHIEWLKQERFKFCLSCNASQKNIAGQLVCSSRLTTKSAVNQEEVYGCGCVLEIKTRSPKASCPANKWLAVDELDLKAKFNKR